MHIFRVNKYITLKLINNKTVIFINNEEFRQCTNLLLNIPLNKAGSFDNLESIDEISDGLDNSYRTRKEVAKVIEIPPETEFWGHCSNMQV